MMDFSYDLTTPINYHSGGENKEAKVVILTAPSNRQRRHAAKLKQCFFQAIKSLSAEEQQAQSGVDAGKPKGSDVVSLLMMSDVDADEVHEAFKGLVTGGCARLDGTEPMNDVTYDSLSFEDTEAMLGDYLVNFLIPSS